MKRVVPVLLAALTGGCVPVTDVAVPALRGRVVDAERRPVDGAQVQVVREFGGGVVAGSVFTAPDGTFSRPAQSHVALQGLIGDRGISPYAVTATDGKRTSAAVRVYGGILGFFDPPLPEKDLGDLPLP